MLRLFATRLPEQIAPSDYERSLARLDEEKRSRISRFRKQEDAMRTLFAELLLRRMLVMEGRVRADHEVVLSAGTYGKPLVVHPAGVHLNVSHSGQWAVLAWDDAPVGIDIEQMKSIDVLHIAKHVFSSHEYERLSKQKEDRLEHFYTLWTLKESYIKMDGRGLSLPLDSFTIIPSGSQFVLLDQPMGGPYFHTYALEPNYRVAVCSKGSEAPPHIQIVDYQALLLEPKQEL